MLQEVDHPRRKGRSVLGLSLRNSCIPLVAPRLGRRKEVKGMGERKRVTIKFEGEKGCGKSRLRSLVWNGLSNSEEIILIVGSDNHELQVEFKVSSQRLEWKEGYEAGVKAGREERV